MYIPHRCEWATAGEGKVVLTPVKSNGNLIRARGKPEPAKEKKKTEKTRVMLLGVWSVYTYQITNAIRTTDTLQPIS